MHCQVPKSVGHGFTGIGMITEKLVLNLFHFKSILCEVLEIFKYRDYLLTIHLISDPNYSLKLFNEISLDLKAYPQLHNSLGTRCLVLF
jgi:hypothetical protein